MFSVVIPLYNKEQSITETIQSVLNQSFQEFEIIVVNDGSKDRSVEVVKQIKDQRIRLVDQKNQGVSAARNKGIKEARNEWIAFLDGDDIWNDDHLATFVDLIQRYKDHYIFTSSFVYSIPREQHVNRPEVKDYVVDNYFKASLTEHLMWTSVVVVHKKCLVDDLFCEDFVRGEDIDLWVRLAQKYKIVKSNHVTAEYKIEAENRSDVNTVDIRKTFFRDVNLSKMKDKYQKQYFRKLMYTKLKHYAVKKEWGNLFYLIKKYI
ncbi:glycosyltransferase family 2 protein [Brumimicrobium aurantiacum]|uniref:Glycosyltransferase family 2 protein n=1 Tax=Brumimicrobium aurantiacum TaxID=1737063 RepID=A0A3E1F0J0_9FLAO|nr:glycosyltransferase family 2 protein [Brumimicrobium aurantiacum]RFC55320.1 glycosyltransferase family 2 protein [Brumimicrobium aurantiacum]